MNKVNLKIAMLGHKRVPSREGGVEIVVQELATRMVNLGHSVTCFNRGGHHVSGSQYDKFETKSREFNGIKLRNVITIDKKGLAALTSSFFASIKAAFGNYDVVHFHAEGPCAFIWIPKLFGKRCVVTIHGLDHCRSKWGKFAKAYILFGEKMAAKYADEITVLSQGVKDYFLEVYQRDTVFIPNGVNKPNNIITFSNIEDKFGIGDRDYILYLGRLVPEKGVHYLIEAYSKLNTEKYLVIAGGSSDSTDYVDTLKSLSESNSKIIYTGFVQGIVMDELYSHAYLYVLPSDVEGMPISLLEAMSYGNCCLTSDIDECSSVICDHGMIFEKSNVIDLKDKLQMLCDNPQIVEEFRNSSADYILSKYNWDTVTKSILALYVK